MATKKERTKSIKLTDNEISLIKQTVADTNYIGCISYVATSVLEKMGAEKNAKGELR